MKEQRELANFVFPDQLEKNINEIQTVSPKFCKRVQENPNIKSQKFTDFCEIVQENPNIKIETEQISGGKGQILFEMCHDKS